jgi:predicted nucleic acid-binding protein
MKLGLMPDREYILDTCVISSSDDHRVDAWLQTVKDSQLYVSVASLMEQRKGIELLRPRKPDTAAEIEQDLNDLIADLGERIVAIDAAVADRWGKILANNPSRNRTDVCLDSAIAASASGRYWIATNNVDDFRGLGLNILNPFKNPPEEVPHEA